MAKKQRSLLVNAALVAAALGLLALAVWTNRVEIRRVFSRPINPFPFALAFAAHLTAVVMTFQRWFLLVRAVELPIAFRDALRLGFIGNVFNLVIPGAVGGDVIKAAFFCREQGEGKKTRAISSIVIDRVLGLLGLFLLGSCSGAIAWGSAPPALRNLILVIWAFLAAGMVGLVVIFTPVLYQPLNRLVAGRPKLSGILSELEFMAASYRRRPGVIAFGLISATCTHALNVFAFYMISQALFGDDPNLPTFLQHYVITPLILFSTAVPLPFGALGLSENVGRALFQSVNYEGGGVTMMGFRVVMYGVGLVSLFVYLANLRQVRDLEDEAEHLADPAAPEPTPS